MLLTESMSLNKRIFLTLFMAVFASTVGVGMVVPLLHAHGWANVYQGHLWGSLSSLSSSLKWSDKRGRKNFLAAGLFAYCVISTAFSIRNIYELLAIRFAHGVASAAILPVAFACVGDQSLHQEGRIMGLFRLRSWAG
jgi:MFS family permease